MRAFAQKPNQTQERASSRPARSDTLAPAGMATRRFGHDFSRISIHPPAGAAAGVKALPTRIRAGMERSFGVDLGGVRVRDDSAARNSANDLNAKAFVKGGHIFWGNDVADDREDCVAGTIKVAIEADDIALSQRAQPRLAADAPAADAMPVVEQLVERLGRDGRRDCRLCASPPG